MTEYCVMKMKECHVCEGSGSTPIYGAGVHTTCPGCAGTGKAWDPVPLKKALKELGYLMARDYYALYGQGEPNE